jgi:hypothetical protein
MVDARSVGGCPPPGPVEAFPKLSESRSRSGPIGDGRTDAERPRGGVVT